MSRPFFTVPIATQKRVDQFECGELLEYLAVPTIELQ
jgi:hypothetical protein